MVVRVNHFLKWSTKHDIVLQSNTSQINGFPNDEDTFTYVYREIKLICKCTSGPATCYVHLSEILYCLNHQPIRWSAAESLTWGPHSPANCTCLIYNSNNTQEVTGHWGGVCHSKWIIYITCIATTSAKPTFTRGNYSKILSSIADTHLNNTCTYVQWHTIA